MEPAAWLHSSTSPSIRMEIEAMSGSRTLMIFYTNSEMARNVEEPCLDIENLMVDVHTVKNIKVNQHARNNLN